MVQSVSTPACHAGGRRFESVPGRQKEKTPFWVSFLFATWNGLVEGGLAEGKAKNMPVTCFLARGRVHGSMTAAGRAVGIDPYFSNTVSICGGICLPFIFGPGTALSRAALPPSRPKKKDGTQPASVCAYPFFCAMSFSSCVSTWPSTSSRSSSAANRPRIWGLWRWVKMVLA